MTAFPSTSKVSLTLTLNNLRVSLSAEPRRLLSDFLRHDCGATGTHVGCEHGVCGVCTVLVDGAPVRSCLMFAYQVQGCEVVTIEGLAKNSGFEDVRKAFRKHHALQCGYCTPGFLTTLYAWLETEPESDETALREELSGVLCRCTGYAGIVDAALEVAAERKANRGKANV